MDLCRQVLTLLLLLSLLPVVLFSAVDPLPWRPGHAGDLALLALRIPAKTFPSVCSFRVKLEARSS